MEIKENMIGRFEELAGINFDSMLKEKHNIKMVSFNKFQITDELNLKALKAQGFNQEYIKLDTMRNAGNYKDYKTVYLFMILKNTVKKFYPCIVIETREKMETVKNQKSDVSVVPQKIGKPEGIRTIKLEASVEKKSVGNKNEKNIVINPVIPQNSFVSREEFNELNAKIDALLNFTLEKKVSIFSKKSK